MDPSGKIDKIFLKRWETTRMGLPWVSVWGWAWGSLRKPLVCYGLLMFIYFWFSWTIKGVACCWKDVGIARHCQWIGMISIESGLKNSGRLPLCIGICGSGSTYTSESPEFKRWKMRGTPRDPRNMIVETKCQQGLVPSAPCGNAKVFIGHSDEVDDFFSAQQLLKPSKGCLFALYKDYIWMIMNVYYYVYCIHIYIYIYD